MLPDVREILAIRLKPYPGNDFLVAGARTERARFSLKLTASAYRDRDVRSLRTHHVPCNEQRLSTRVNSLLEVDLHLENGNEITGRLSDLSLSGLFLESDASPAPGTQCTVELFPAGREHALVIEASGCIARSNRGGIAVCFDEISTQAFERLSALVMTAVQDPSTVEAEIEAQFNAEPAE